MDKLMLNIADIANKEKFLSGLQTFLIVNEATANGIFRIDVDPETDEDKGTIQIINNAPVLPGMEVKYGDHYVGQFWNDQANERRWERAPDTDTFFDYGVRDGSNSNDPRAET